MGVSARAVFSRLLLLFGSVLVSLLLGEGAVRLLAPQSVQVPLQDTIEGITTFRPNTRGRHAVPGTFDVTLTINSQRFRARKDYALEPAPNVLRIAAQGDSSTFGAGANDDQTYPAQLEKILTEMSEAGPVEVIDAGVGGTGTGEQALYYDVWVRQFKPAVVVLAVNVTDLQDDREGALFVLGAEGDVSPRPAAERMAADRQRYRLQRFARALPGYVFLAQHSQLLNLLRNAATLYLMKRRSATLDAGAPVSTGDPKGQLRAGLALLAGEVRWLHARVRESGGRLAVVFIPNRDLVYGPGKDRRVAEAMVRQLQAVCEREGIPFADLREEVRRREQQMQEALYYRGGDVHPTPAGYRVYAEAVAAFLVSHGVVRPPAR